MRAGYLNRNVLTETNPALTVVNNLRRSHWVDNICGVIESRKMARFRIWSYKISEEMSLFGDNRRVVCPRLPGVGASVFFNFVRCPCSVLDMIVSLVSTLLLTYSITVTRPHIIVSQLYNG